MKSTKKLLFGMSAIIFISFEALMFYLIHIKVVDTELNLRYISVIAAVIFSWLTLIIELMTTGTEITTASAIICSKAKGNLIRIAMLFTLVADYYMVALDEPDNLSGVTVFLGTQFFIFLHIVVNDKNKNTRLANIVFRVVLSFIMVAVVYYVLGNNADSTAIISAVYYANLCTNVVFAHRIGRGGTILTIGLILFALCDINVGLTALEIIYTGGFPEGSLLYNIVNSELDFIWIFYIPSQTLIPLTLLFTDKNK